MPVKISITRETGPEDVPGILEVFAKHGNDVLGAVDELAARLERRAINQLKAQAPKGRPGRPTGLISVDIRKIKQVREELTQPEFARILKISVDTLQRAENQGVATKATIRKINNFAKKSGLSLSL